MTPPDVVLVPSPLLPPATWEPVRARLGPPPARTVVLPIDPGGSIWRQQVEAVAAELAAGGPAVVAFHSGAGALAGAVVDAAGSAVVGLAFLDAMLPAPGTSRLDQIAAEGGDPADLEKLVSHLAGGGRFPVWGERTWARLVRDPVVREDLRGGLVPHAEAYWREVIASSDRWEDLPGLFVRCSETYDRYADQAQGLGWEVVTGPDGHLAMVDQPEETATALQRWLVSRSR